MRWYAKIMNMDGILLFGWYIGFIFLMMWHRRFAKRVGMVRVGGVVWSSVMWWCDHDWLHAMVVNMRWPVVMVVDHGYWYRTKYRYGNLSDDWLINRHWLENPLNQGLNRRGCYGLPQNRSHYLRTR